MFITLFLSINDTAALSSHKLGIEFQQWPTNTQIRLLSISRSRRYLLLQVLQDLSVGKIEGQEAAEKHLYYI